MVFLGSRTVSAVVTTPTATLVASPQYAVVGSVITLDARGSSDSSGADLAYTFSVTTVPIGSQAKLGTFTELDDETGYVSFVPDLAGKYVSQVAVSNGSYSSTASVEVDIRAVLVPHANGVVPDGKFIWSYLRDAWTQVDGKEFFETLWSALIQISGSELLKLYQVDYDKSIKDIQSFFQRRWLAYEPRLALTTSDLSLYLGYTMAGTGAVMGPTGLTGQVVATSSTEVLVVRGTVRPDAVGQDLSLLYSEDAAHIGAYRIVSVAPTRNGYRIDGAPADLATANTVADGYAFSFTGPGTPPISGGPLTWNMPPQYQEGSLGHPLLVGDVISVRSGANAGLYTITNVTASTVTVDRRPPKFSDGAVCTVYRPMGFSLPAEALPGSSTINIALEGNETLLDLVPGRIIIVNGQGYTITRVSADRSQRVPVAVIGVDKPITWSRLAELPWRIPDTLVSASQDFEALGVSAGDALLVSVGHDTVSTTLKLNVVGVDRKRLGFVVSDEPTEAGVVPGIPNDFYLQLSTDLAINRVTENGDGTLTFAETAAQILQYLRSSSFRSAFWNQEIEGELALSISGIAFIVREVAVIRNSLIPVDETLRSVPSLQEVVVVPDIKEEDGKLYEIRNGKEFAIERRPVVLKEGAHYLVDAESCVKNLVFRMGTNVIQADGADFLDSGFRVGDRFYIESPYALGVDGPYRITEVLSNDTIVLDRQVPVYGGTEFVSAHVKIVRAREGRFLRFVPGLYSAKSPLPNRLWAEASLFDNTEAIENNFGMLVGLKRDDFIDVESAVEYRQAVTGVMYALTKGSTLDKIRLGAQILVGLPFAEHRGIIRTIDPIAKRDFFTGAPTYGRIVVEDVEDDDTPMGVVRFYFYPIDSDSRLAGLEQNPSTGAAYAVGDVVERFTPLCKGVEVSDYISEPSHLPSLESLLQRYHGLRVRANDMVFGATELSAVSGFLRRITPSYVAYYLTMLTETSDSPSITDHVLLRGQTGKTLPPISDNVSMGLPFAVQYDQRTLRAETTCFYDDGVFTIRRAGNDLSTTSSTITVVGGGLEDARAAEVFESPLCEVGDRLIIRGGINAGVYTISGLTDTTITLSDGPAEGFETLDDQTYLVVREVKAKLFTGTATYTSGQTTVSIPSSYLRTRGVMPGDFLVLGTGASAYRYTIISVEETTPDSGVWDKVTVTPALKSSGTEAACSVFRPNFFVSPSVETYSITSDGTSTLTAVPDELRALYESGDELLLHERDDLLRVVVIDPRLKYVLPALAAGTYSVKLCRVGRAATPVSFDIAAAQVPYDETFVTLIGRNSNTVNTAVNGVVSFPVTGTFSSTVRPGDRIIFTSGANASTDVGYGAGVFVVGAATATNLTTTSALTADTGVTFKLLRRVYRA